MRTEVAIVGAGPAGLLLAHLLAQDGIESVLIEARTPDYVLGRLRAGVLESSTVDVLTRAGVGERLHREGMEHSGIYLQWPGRRHHLDFVELIGESVTVYGQTELTRDLMDARQRAGQRSYYEAADVVLHDIDSEAPSAAFTDATGVRRTVHAAAIAGCDGFHGVSRTSIPAARQRIWERTYPYAWLGVLAAVPPSTDELIYAWHPEGFALHSMRSESTSRLYLQVDAAEDLADWPDERIWDALALRLGHGQDGWELERGDLTGKAVLPMRSFVSAPMRYGRLFLAGDAAHIVPPTGAKGLNLAVADVTLLSRALRALVREGSTRLADDYSESALRRVWRCTHFSWWMTSMLHTSRDEFDSRLQLSQLEWVASSTAAATGLAENYAGLPIEFQGAPS
ncbi:4-hydroxybenzoate 3-monooxygenase [Nocardia sp. NPDC051570]|uniref:4-hydroxybenzoate 3-monooxygenase n=1 Tax=Nocardia sp. NPDC051570 TaxID=3364324 RepID=UPI0037B7ED48